MGKQNNFADINGQTTVNETIASTENKPTAVKDEVSIKRDTYLYNLVEKAQQGDMAAMENIIRHFRKEINGKAKMYYIAGADYDDVVQEAMIGLYKAIKTYDKNGGAKFDTYANLCMKRQLLNAIRSANREKHEPLNSSVSINKMVAPRDGMDYDETTLEETIQGNAAADIDVIKVLNDTFDSMNNGPQALSRIEADVWREYTEGKSYEEIAQQLGKPVKSVYNAMARLKKKILLYISE